MTELVMLLLASAAFAEPDTVPLPPDSGAVTTTAPPEAPLAEVTATDSSFAAVLEEAKERYFRGESGDARDLLQSLKVRLYAGEEVEWSLIVEALTYLGEIYYVQGDREQAKTAFEYLLNEDPNTPISPYHHAIEVVDLFEVVRGEVVKRRDAEARRAPPPTVVVRTPAPITTYLPFGVPQLAQGRTGVGVFYGTLQAGFGITSLAMYAHLRFANPALGTVVPPHPLDWEPEVITSRVQQRRFLYQWPATFAFYAMWGISAVDAAVYHQRHPRVTRVGIEPLPPADPTLRPSGGGGLPILVIHGQL